MFATGSGYRLGIDFGTSNTVAVLGHPGGRLAVLLFDGSPTLPSAVCLDSSGRFLTGHDAIHAARINPTGFEPNPKRLVDEGVVLLGGAELAVAELIRAVLARVATEAQRVAGAPIGEVTLSFPAAWAAPRRSVLLDAAARAGLPGARMVAEPVAAAQYFLGTNRIQLPVGACAVVYDLGGGTFDATVVRRLPGGFEVLATEGLGQAGGLDIDAAVVDYLGTVYAGRHDDAWHRLTQPSDATQRRVSRQLWDDVRAAKETLSRNATTAIHLPLIEQDAPLGREQLEDLARPILAGTIATTRAALAMAGVPAGSVAGLFLVGGGSRVPLVATMLRRELGLSPIAIEQPELVVAQGSLMQVSVPAPVAVPVQAQPVSVAPRPVSVPPRPVSAPPPGYRQPAPVWRPPPPPLAPSYAIAPTVLTVRPTAPPRPPRKRRKFPIWLRVLVIIVLLVGGCGGVIDWRLRSYQSNQTKSAPLTGLTGTIDALALSPDGKVVAVADGSGAVVLFDTASRQRLSQLIRIPAAGTILELVFSADSTTVATVGPNDVYLWSLTDTRQPTAHLTAEFGFNSVAFSPDGGRLAIGNNSGLFVWEIKTTKWLVQPPKNSFDSAEAVAFTPDGKTIFRDTIVDVDNLPKYEVQAYDAATGAAQGDPLIGHTQGVTRLAISPDGGTVATASADHTIRLWSTADRRETDKLVSGSDQIGGVTFSPDGSRLVATLDGTVLIYDVAAHKQLASINVTGSHAAVMAPDNRTFVAGGYFSVRVYTLPARLGTPGTTPSRTAAPTRS